MALFTGDSLVLMSVPLGRHSLLTFPHSSPSPKDWPRQDSQKHPSGEQRRDTHKAGPNYAGLMVDCRLVVVDEESCRSRKAVCVAQLWLLANSSSFALSHNESAPILPKLQRLCWSVHKHCWKWYHIPAHTLVAVDGPVTARSLAETIAAPKSTNQTAS